MYSLHNSDPCDDGGGLWLTLYRPELKTHPIVDMINRIVFMLPAIFIN